MDKPYLNKETAECDSCTDRGHCPEYAAGKKCVSDRPCTYILIDEDRNVFTCSRCRHLLSFREGGPFANDVRHCPNCGRRIIAVER